MNMEKNKIINFLNEATDSLDESIVLLQEKTKEFEDLSALADAKRKPEIGHTYNDMANMLRVMTGHAQTLSALTVFEKGNHEAILDLFELAKKIDESALKKDEFKEKLEKLEKSNRNILSKFPLKLENLKLNFGIASATFKPKDEK